MAACTAQADAVADAQPDACVLSPQQETTSSGPEVVVSLCQQLARLQEAAVTVCELLATQQSMLERSAQVAGGASQHHADTQVQAL